MPDRELEEDPLWSPRTTTAVKEGRQCELEPGTGRQASGPLGGKDCDRSHGATAVTRRWRRSRPGPRASPAGGGGRRRTPDRPGPEATGRSGQSEHASRHGPIRPRMAVVSAVPVIMTSSGASNDVREHAGVAPAASQTPGFLAVLAQHRSEEAGHGQGGLWVAWASHTPRVAIERDRRSAIVLGRCGG